MSMVFFTSTTTPLFSSRWSPTSTGTYAGTCIFLIALAIVFRGLLAGKSVLERRWRDKALDRQYVAVRGMKTEAERMTEDDNAKDGVLITARGVETDVRVVKNHKTPAMAWRFSTDLPHAFYVTVIAGVAYLLSVLA